MHDINVGTVHIVVQDSDCSLPMLDINVGTIYIVVKVWDLLV
jgi:hypothetical protein